MVTGVRPFVSTSFPARDYGSDIYRMARRTYDGAVVWQFWGRAARGRPEHNRSGRLFLWRAAGLRLPGYNADAFSTLLWGRGDVIGERLGWHYQPSLLFPGFTAVDAVPCLVIGGCEHNLRWISNLDLRDIRTEGLAFEGNTDCAPGRAGVG